MELTETLINDENHTPQRLYAYRHRRHNVELGANENPALTSTIEQSAATESGSGQ